MAGKHEPDAKRSFYLSLATATLRAGLVIAAVVLGIFVLSRAFPGAGDESQGPGPVTTDGAEESPGPEESPQEDGGGGGGGGGQAPQEVALRGVTVNVQNGTGVTGLAADTAEELRGLGLRIREIGDAARHFDVTTLYFAQGSRPEAEELNATFFNGEANVQRMPAELEDDVQISVVLGQDYADAQG
ncbi:MAG TPA: LytR C-terminal domain-containing protein [Actinomycetota bacterium]